MLPRPPREGVARAPAARFSFAETAPHGMRFKAGGFGRRGNCMRTAVGVAVGASASEWLAARAALLLRVLSGDAALARDRRAGGQGRRSVAPSAVRLRRPSFGGSGCGD